MYVQVSSAHIDLMLREAARAHPQECCGILLGRSEGKGSHITAVQPAANVHRDPHTHFEIDPQALVDAHRAGRQGGAQVVGYYHSHPSGPPDPSATDRAGAPGDGRIWAIIAGEVVRFWQDLPEGFVPLSYGECRG